MQLDTIKRSLRLGDISSFWMMLRSQAEDDAVLGMQVEGWCRHQNAITGDSSLPKWLR
jgi:hypothetical protein